MLYLIPKTDSESKKCITINEDQLKNAIYNAIFKQYKKCDGSLGDLTYWDLANMLQKTISQEIIEDRNDIFNV